MTDEIKTELKKSLLQSLIKGGPTTVVVSIFCYFFYTQNLEYAKRDEERKIQLEVQLKECHEEKIELYNSLLTYEYSSTFKND